MSLEKLEDLPQSGVVAIIGSQWGDEGKGKIVDLFASWADVVARGTGGANAGHTIVVNGTSHIFHLVPSAILRDQEGVTNIIGRGVAFDPVVMLEELSQLDALGISYENLRISQDAHLVLPQHKVLDQVREAKAAQGRIGTTGRGIGPTYADHILRCGLTVRDLLNEHSFRRKLTRNLAAKEDELHSLKELVGKVMQLDLRLKRFYAEEMLFDFEHLVESYLEYGRRLRPFIADTDQLLQSHVFLGHCVLLEGAQATLLSIDRGIYPYVTSSDSTIEGLAKGVGLTRAQVDIVFGIVKAPYMTRVGAGVFPTELSTKVHDLRAAFLADINSADPYEQSLAIRREGREFGSTTGRPRRIGWLDLPLLRYAALYGLDRIILTKLDVLSGCKEIKVCTHYTYTGEDYDFGDRILRKGDIIKVALGDDELMASMEPSYQSLEGWDEGLTGLRSDDTLPQSLESFILFLEETIGKPVAIVSVGPDRDQTICR